MKVVTIVGARPQFVKAAMVSAALAEKPSITEILIHTGQHYDADMAQVFFDDLSVPTPWRNLGIGGLSHGAGTGRTLEAVEVALMEVLPDALLVYGDTNATLAGALAAAKMNIPVAHVEAGLRSFDRTMPEEVNRCLTDHLSTWLFCPTPTAVENLKAEGITDGVHHVGDVMYDATLRFTPSEEKLDATLATFDLERKGYVLLTAHREANTDNTERFAAIATAFAEIARHEPVIFPMHPRCHAALERIGGAEAFGDTRIVAPQPFAAMQALERGARVIATDSGGVQKEAYFHGTPCVTLRENTEWGETVTAGANRLVGVETDAIVAAVKDAVPLSATPPLFGDGHAARTIALILAREPA